MESAKPDLIVIHPDCRPSRHRLAELAGVKSYCSINEDARKIERLASLLQKGAARLPLVESVEKSYPVEMDRFSAHIAGLAESHQAHDYWWLSPYVEKNGYPSEYLLTDLVEGFFRVQECRDTCLFITSNEYFAFCLKSRLAGRRVRVLGSGRFALSFLKKYIKFPLELGYSVCAAMKRMACARLFGLHKMTERERSSISSCLIRTYVNETLLGTDGAYRDSHYGDMPELLRARGKSWAYESNPSSVTQARKFYRWVRGQAREPFFVPEAFWTMGDLLRALLCALRHAAFMHANGFPFLCKTRSFYAHMTIMSYLKSLTPLLLYRLGVTPRTMVFNWENKGHEKRMLELYRRHHPATTVKGYANGFISPLFLEACVSPQEIARTPLPDQLLCMSRFVKDALREVGYPAGILRECCSFRDKYIHEARPRCEEGGKPVLLVCLSIQTKRSLELLDLMEEFASSTDGYRVVLRFHPFSEQALQQRASAYRNGAGRRLEVSAASVDDDIRRSWAVIMTGPTNMICEAYAAGKLTLKYLSPNYLNQDCLFYYPEAKVSPFSSPAELLTRLSEGAGYRMDRDIRGYLFGECSSERAGDFC